MKHDRLLIELGVQELPAGLIDRLLETLSERWSLVMSQQGIAYESMHSEATPRRLVWWFEQCASHQPSRVQERLGPLLTYHEGQPAPACLGFARSCGVPLDNLETRDTPKGPRLVHQIQQKAQSLQDKLPDMLAHMSKPLPGFKLMRWGQEEHLFLRPVAWLFIQHGDTPLSASWMGIDSQPVTYGHRFHHPEPLSIPHVNQYAQILAEQGHVLVERKQRRQRMIEQIARVLPSGAEILDDPALLDEVTHLVEWPVALYASFDEAYLALPAALIQSVCRDHQKCFVVQQGGQLMAGFVAISHIDSQNPQRLKQGLERVLSARLADAWFFYQQDLKRSLQDHASSLSQLVFAQNAGTFQDKAQRLERMLFAWRSNQDRQDCKQLASLCKADLRCQTVEEFPDLAGVIGAALARAAGYDNSLAQAIEEHHWPSKRCDALPTTPTGQDLALIDRLDTLVTMVAAGYEATGDKDPYGLRRICAAVVRLGVTQQAHTLNSMLTIALDPHTLDAATRQRVASACHAMITERFRSWASNQGATAQEWLAVQRFSDDMQACAKRLEALKALRGEPLKQLAGLHKRASQLLKKVDELPAQKAVMVHEAERALQQALQQARQAVEQAMQGHNYETALQSLLTLSEPLVHFFDTVMVMDEDAEVRQRRLGLLKELSELCLRVADVAQIQ